MVIGMTSVKMMATIKIALFMAKQTTDRLGRTAFTILSKSTNKKKRGRVCCQSKT